MVKAFGCTIEEALHDISYTNLVMYNSILPSYESKRADNKDGEVINASDPKNREKVRRIMFGD